MIKEYRINNKYTQETMAKLLNISPRQYQRIEKNVENTKISTLKRLIKILKISDKDIIKILK